MLIFRGLLLPVILVFPVGASALSLTVSGPTTVGLTTGIGIEPAGGLSQITFQVGLDSATPINGYDVSIAWDTTELQFSSATPVWAGLAFTSPSPTESNGARVADLNLALTGATGLFDVTFNVLASLVSDGQPDFRVFVDSVTNGSGLSPGSLANPSGAGINVVPEPGSLVLVAAGLLILRRASRKHR